MPAGGRVPTVGTMQTLTYPTAVDLAAGVRAGRLSPREIVDTCLARIAATDPEIGAFQLVDADGARRAAGALAGRADLSDLPLAGVPVAIKDNLDVAGLPTRHGSAATSPRPAVRDDPLVARLRAAGAVVVGKTRMPELAVWGFTESRAFGGTRNPRDPSRNAGGSTGGGAAAVAAGMVPLAIGSDGGGSLRIPAANCGVVGVKPGRAVDALASGHWYGCTAFGPIAATVADAALALDVLAGVDRWRQVRDDGAPLRFAVSLRSPSPIGRPDAAARAALALAASLAGRVVRADPPYPRTLINQWARCWLAGVAREVDERGLDPARLNPVPAPPWPAAAACAGVDSPGRPRRSRGGSGCWTGSPASTSSSRRSSRARRHRPAGVPAPGTCAPTSTAPAESRTPRRGTSPGCP